VEQNRKERRRYLKLVKSNRKNLKVKGAFGSGYVVKGVLKGKYE